ncbi:MAG: hypothetical protein ACOYMG_26550, partial [Candidatus Methylumidiphilus sp.]
MQATKLRLGNAVWEVHVPLDHASQAYKPGFPNWSLGTSKHFSPFPGTYGTILKPCGAFKNHRGMLPNVRGTISVVFMV